MSVMRVIIAGGRLSFHPREVTDVADYSELFFSAAPANSSKLRPCRPGPAAIEFDRALAWFLQEGALVGEDYNLHRGGPFVRV